MADKNLNREIDRAREDLPGAAIDAADDNRVEKGAVRADVKELNDNPRDTDLKMP